MHGHGSRRRRRLSSGSAGGAVNVWRISPRRLRGGTRAASIGHWLSMEESLQHHAAEPGSRCGATSAKRYRVASPPVGRCGTSTCVRHGRCATKGSTAKSGLGQIVDTVSIRERPADGCAVPGHWEGDLLCGANNTHIVTLVERHTRFAMLLKVPSKDTATVVAALGKHVSKLPQQLRRSLTWDRGKEMADHKNFAIATNAQVYFCRAVPGSASAMSTPTACCDSISRGEQTPRASLSRT